MRSLFIRQKSFSDLSLNKSGRFKSPAAASRTSGGCRTAFFGEPLKSKNFDEEKQSILEPGRSFVGQLQFMPADSGLGAVAFSGCRFEMGTKGVKTRVGSLNLWKGLEGRNAVDRYNMI